LEPKRLKKPVPELRADLLADPRTKDMAARLGMTLEAYVEKVLDFAQHPEKVPVLNVAPDAQVKAEGGATTEEVKAWFQEELDAQVSSAEKSRVKDGFDDPKRKGNR
jgi:hypothetical protein